MPSWHQHHEGDPRGLFGDRFAPIASAHRSLILRADGACRGNPGPASIGVALFDATVDGAQRPDATPIASISAAIGTTTNNVAEWKAVVSGLELAVELGARDVLLLLDSKLVVEQLSERWRVRDAKLAPYYDEAHALLARLSKWSARHVPREQNGRADELANEALDRALVGGPAWVTRRPEAPTSDRATSAATLDDASLLHESVSARAATRVTFLGCGASRGVPRVGCRCAVCLSRDVRNHRTRSAALVEWIDGESGAARSIVIDPGMDLRMQALRFGIERLDGALVTHIHVDHTGGIDELRAYTDAQDEVLLLGAGPETAAELRQRWEYAVDGRTAPGHGIPALRIEVAEPTLRVAGRHFEAIPIVHGKREAHGWRSGGFAYLTDVAHVAPTSRTRLLGLDLLVVSALRDLAHPTHQTVDEALELVAALAPARAVLTHLDHDLDYEELAGRLPDNVFAAFDGLVVAVPSR